ncbi:MAG: hypothetical protein V2I57_08210 [Xanthomonadales bacterium]|jgi:hypothetical protein|nr:hypothetical protein [Xanthomonadales bacterium]
MTRRLTKLHPQLTAAVASLLTMMSCGSAWAAEGSANPGSDAWGLAGGLVVVLALIWMLGLYLQSTRRRMV